MLEWHFYLHISVQEISIALLPLWIASFKCAWIGQRCAN